MTFRRCKGFNKLLMLVSCAVHKLYLHKKGINASQYCLLIGYQWTVQENKTVPYTSILIQVAQIQVTKVLALENPAHGFRN